MHPFVMHVYFSANVMVTSIWGWWLSSNASFVLC